MSRYKEATITLDEVRSVTLEKVVVIQEFEDTELVDELKRRGFYDWADNATDSELVTEIAYRSLSLEVLNNCDDTKLEEEMRNRNLEVFGERPTAIINTIVEDITLRGIFNQQDIVTLLEQLTGKIVFPKKV